MKTKHLLSLVTTVALLVVTSTGYSQNVGIGQNAPVSKLDVKGNLTVGVGYSGTSAPTNGAIIQGNVGIGTTSPAQTLEIAVTTGTIRIDGMIAGNSFNTSASSASNLVFVNKTTGDLSALANGSNGQVMSLNGSGVPTWVTPTTGTVTSTSAGNLSPLFTTSVTTPTTTPAISYTLSNAGTETIFGNNTGSSTTPVYFSPSLSSALFANQGTTTTILHGNGSGNPSWSQIGLTTDVTGTLPVANGGTGLTSYTAGTLLDASSSSVIGQIADVTAGSYLRSAGSGNVPVWSTLTLPNAAAIGDILYASGTNAIGNLSDVATGKALVSGGIGAAPTWGQVGLTTGVTGILPIANGGTNSGTALSGSGIMISNGTQIIQGAAGTTTTVLHGNASGAPTYSAVSLTTDVTGTLPVGNGGTGLTSYTTGSLIDVSAATTVGQINDVTAGSYLRSAGAGVVPVWSTLTLPNAATTGDLLYASGTNAIGNLSDVATGNVLISGGTGTAPSWGKVALASAVSGTLPVANGGTGLTTAASNGQLLIGNGSGYTLGTLTPGTGITITNTAGAITIASSGSSSGWSLTGNGSTTPGTNYVGTTDGNALVFKTDAFEGMRLTNGGGSASGNLVLGSGEASTTVAGGTLRAPSAAGSNLTGADLTITSGNGTGTTGSSGNIIFQTAPSNASGSATTANTMTEAMRINSAGNVGFGTNAPATQVDINGNLALRNTVITGASGTYTLNPNGYSFVELQSTGNFTLNTISGGVNGYMLIVWNSPTSGHTMTLGTTGNIKEYTSGGGSADIITLVYSSAHSEWVMIAAQ